ncbi:MAG TPA: acyl-CoA desaturase [Solimonas sp.]|nr:acyl-CoA desaturase [Solimonas sp.]
MDALRQSVVDDLGQKDADHIRKVVRIARGSAIAGRSLLMFGFGPVSWIAGIAALANAKILENMEIGHNVMHGQYDWMNDPSLESQSYEWDNVCDSEHWRHSHNYMHHTYTNILGKDKDVGYGLLRVAEEQYWKPKHLIQPVSNVLLSSLFQWGVGVHDVEWGKALKGEMSWKEVKEQFRPFMRKAGKQLFKDYVFFPVIALWNAPRVLAGNFIANGIRNVWSNVIIFCGHFPEGTRVYTQEETANETRGDWYIRQMQGSANIEGGKLMHLMSGHLSHQIEHHLFPDIPAHRYPEMAPKVQALCRKYGLSYNSASFWRQYGSVLKIMFKHALPKRRARIGVPALA